MGWWGKLLGGTFGFMLGGPLGALLGAALGHSFDSGLKTSGAYGGLGAADQERIQSAFFTATFSVMGHLAKVDGRVSQDEIQLARMVMAQMQLSEEQKRTAINLFDEGKQPGFPLHDVIEQFRRECHRRNTLLRMFLEIQIHAAYADGVMHAAESQVLLDIAARLGFSRHEFQHLEAMVRAQRDFAGAGAPGKSPRDLLKEAYAVLDVPQSASNDEVKKAYRRLMNQHHPDKLVSKGLPEEMMKLATEKTQEIKAAYEQIRKARGF